MHPYRHQRLNDMFEGLHGLRKARIYQTTIRRLLQLCGFTPSLNQSPGRFCDVYGDEGIWAAADL